MYVPTPFRLEEPAAIRDALQWSGFAVLVTAGHGAPEANRLPGHLARGHPQVRALAESEERRREVLV